MKTKFLSSYKKLENKRVIIKYVVKFRENNICCIALFIIPIAI